MTITIITTITTIIVSGELYQINHTCRCDTEIDYHRLYWAWGCFDLEVVLEERCRVMTITRLHYLRYPMIIHTKFHGC